MINIKYTDLLTDAGTGQLSSTKLWTHIAYLVATLVFLRWGIFADEPPSEWLWLVYLGVVGGHTVLSKLVSLKYRDQADK